MSSPVTPPPFTPVPVPPPLPPRQRSITGPFVLILIGTLFLLGTMRVISVSRMWHLFANYWPLLLIFWGVLKLIEHQQAKNQGYRPVGIGAGGVLLVVMIVVFGLIATQVEHFSWRDHFNIDDDDFSNIFGNSYSFDDHLQQAFPAGSSLKVIDTRGAVSIHAADDNNITVVVHKRLGAENQGDADKYNRETKPTITTIGGLVTVDANSEAAGDHSVETDLDISVPKKVAVTVSSRRGDVTVVGREGNLDISAQHSDTSIEDVIGSVKISQEKGSVKIEQVTGDVHVGGRMSDVSVTDVKGTVALEGEFQESVKVARVDKTVTFKSSRTDMEFSKIEGTLDLDSDDLHAETITGPLHLTTRSKNVRLDGVSGDVRLQDDNGNVEVIMHALGNVQIDNRNGEIQFSIPEKAGFRMDARTRGGEVQSDFSELTVNNDDREGKASGTVGNGSAHIVLNNEHEGIEIRRTPANGGTKQAVSVGVDGGAPGARQSKSGKALPAPKEKVEPADN